jgi:hypothetical protein
MMSRQQISNYYTREKNLLLLAIRELKPCFGDQDLEWEKCRICEVKEKCSEWVENYQ